MSKKRAEVQFAVDLTLRREDNTASLSYPDICSSCVSLLSDLPKLLKAKKEPTKGGRSA